MATIKVRKKTKLVIGQIPPWNDSIEWHMMTRECNLKKPVPSPVRAKEIPIYRVKMDKATHGWNWTCLFTYAAKIYEKTC